MPRCSWPETAARAVGRLSAGNHRPTSPGAPATAPAVPAVRSATEPPRRSAPVRRRWLWPVRAPLRDSHGCGQTGGGGQPGCEAVGPVAGQHRLAYAMLRRQRQQAHAGDHVRLDCLAPGVIADLAAPSHHIPPGGSGHQYRASASTIPLFPKLYNALPQFAGKPGNAQHLTALPMRDFEVLYQPAPCRGQPAQCRMRDPGRSSRPFRPRHFPTRAVVRLFAWRAGTLRELSASARLADATALAHALDLTHLAVLAWPAAAIRPP